MRQESFEEQTRCPLCGCAGGSRYHEDAVRVYCRCGSCGLVFVPRRYWLGAAEERAEYDLHENDADDPGYRRFLSRLADPLLERLPPGQRGLDFGCGPAPALAGMLAAAGHHVELYDPFYADHPAVLEAQYDFICATEVAEHLHDPQREFVRLFACLKPGGWLGLMTKLARGDLKAFSNWHYIRDLTHVCFYSRDTFAYLARQFGARCIVIGQDVVLMQKAGLDPARPH